MHCTRSQNKSLRPLVIFSKQWSFLGSWTLNIMLQLKARKNANLRILLFLALFVSSESLKTSFPAFYLPGPVSQIAKSSTENVSLVPHRAHDAFHLWQKTRPAPFLFTRLTAGNLSWKWGGVTAFTFTYHWSSKDCEWLKGQNQSRKYESQEGDCSGRAAQPRKCRRD